MVLTQSHCTASYCIGVPPGVKKMDMVKAVRVKKYVMEGRKMVLLPTWNTDAEIAYQALVQEFTKQMLPNNKVRSD